MLDFSGALAVTVSGSMAPPVLVFVGFTDVCVSFGSTIGVN